MRTRLLIGGAILLVAAGVLWSRYGAGEEPREKGWMRARKVTVSTQDLVRAVEAVGLVEPAFVLEVKSKASGEIVSMPYEEGDHVRQGALLVELRPVDEERNLRKQRATVLAAEASVAKARNAVKIAELELVVSREQTESRLEKAQVDHEVATAELKRQKSLFQRDLVSRKELDDARRSAEQAEADLEVARSQQRAVRLEELEIEARRQDARLQQAALEKEKVNLEVAEIRLAETRIHAPMDGLVLDRPVELGQIIASGISNVSGGTTLMSLADVRLLYMEAEVDESDIGGILEGLDVEVTAEAFPDSRFQGLVDRVAPRGEEDQNVTIFRVRIKLGREAVSVLKPGMNATARIIVERRPGALVAPAEAIRRRGRKVGVMRAAPNGPPDFVPVKLGLREGKLVEVRGELREGDELLLPDPDTGGRGRGGGQGRAMRQGWRAMRRAGGS